MPLRRGSDNCIYELDLELVLTSPGIYLFVRAHGDTRSVLYVGKEKDLRARIKQQLNALKLMMAIKNSQVGARELVFAEFIGKAGAYTRKWLPIIERVLIRHYLSADHPLLNIQGTNIANHELVSTRPVLRDLIPKRIVFE